MCKYYTIAFTNEELHQILEQLKSKTKLDFEFNDFPNVEDFENLNAVVLYLDNDLTYSGLLHLFTQHGDPESPFVNKYQFINNSDFIKIGIVRFMK